MAVNLAQTGLGLGYTPENAANKDVANGYAGLTAGALLKPAEFPAPTSSLFGGIKSLAAVAKKYLTSIGTDGIPVAAQPASTDLSDLPIPVSSGGTGKAQAGQYGVMVARSGVSTPFTGATAESVIATMTVPAGLLSASGQIKFEAALATGTLAGTYTLNVRVGGLTGTTIINQAGVGGSSFQRVFGTIAARNATNSQIAWCWAKVGSVNMNVPDTTSAKDFTASVDIVVTVTLTNAADTVTLEGYNLTVYP